MTKLVFANLVLILSLIEPARATEASTDPVKQTQDLLTDPVKRKQAMAAKPETQKLAGQLKTVVGSYDNIDATFGLASDVFGKMAQDADGDPDKISAIIQAAQKDPEAFAKKMTPAQRQQLHDIAAKAPGANPTPTKK